MVQRMTGPDAVSARSLAREVGVASTTLSNWQRRAGRILAMSKKNDSGKFKQPPNDRPAEEKLRLVVEAARLSDEELGAFLRREGVHEHHLIAWRRSILDALGTSSGASKKGRRGSPVDTKKIKVLEKELRRKEKALAEAAALLVLKKKADAIWGDEDDDTGGRNDG